MYVPEPPTAVGDRFDVWLRVPAGSGISRVIVRQVHDGEPVGAAAQLDRTDAAGNRWYRATLLQANPTMRYRFLTDAGPQHYRWVTAAGPRDHDPADAGDFVSSIYPGGPPWLAQAIAYQIFPDRFARSSRIDTPAPTWARPMSWDDLPSSGGRGAAEEWFGGDLYGVLEHLDHVASVGANLLYLTPVFPARSTHRYNASTFAHVDPLLGGDVAYRALIEQAHRRGMRVIGDLTTNHTGYEHEWFTAARTDPAVAEAGHYSFRRHPDDYEAWLGHRSLPKLNYNDPAVLDKLVSGADAPLRRYLRPDIGLDGWRIDVANMTGRQGATDVNGDVRRAIRAAVMQERTDAYLVAEHFHDYTSDLDGPGWQGVMNYAGFTRPLWTWLVGQDLGLRDWLGLPWPGWPRLPGDSVLASMQQFAAVAWQNRLAGMSIVSSHDTPRIRTITGDPALVEVAAAAMFTMPGVPMIWAGDEIGLEGTTGEDGRRPFPWHRPDSWDGRTLAAYRALASVRASNPPLQSGSLRWLYCDDDRLVFVREDRESAVLVLLARAPGPPIRLPAAALDRGEWARIHPDTAEDAAPAVGILPGGGPGAWIWRCARP